MEDILKKHFRKTYENSPSAIRNILGILYSKVPSKYRYGKEFVNYNNLLNETQWYSKKKIEDFQLKKFKELVEYVYKYVPYYKEYMMKNDLTPNDFNNINDIKKFPIIDKDIIRENYSSFISDIHSEKMMIKVTTGGSSGTPFEILHHRGITGPREKAFQVRQWSWVGFNLGDKCVVIRGKKLENNKIFEMDYTGNSLLLSSYDLDEKNYQTYIDEIFKFKPIAIQAFPSSILQLARIINSKGGIPKIPSLKVVICASENLYSEQRCEIEKAFGCRVFSTYGMTEYVTLAGECEVNSKYHVFSEYGLFELLDENNEVIDSCDISGEIVATGFNNFVMPLIRYRTGDISSYSSEECSCGRPYFLLNGIEGRKQDLIITKDYKKIPLVALIFAQHFAAFERVKSLQIVQNEIGKLLINIVKLDEFKKKDELEITNKILDCCNQNIELKINYVTTILTTHRGKHKFLIQNLLPNHK